MEKNTKKIVDVILLVAFVYSLVWGFFDGLDKEDAIRAQQTAVAQQVEETWRNRNK